MMWRSLFFLFLWLAPHGAWALDPSLEDFQKIRDDPVLHAQLQSIVDVAVARALGTKVELPQTLSPLLKKPRALFVTFASDTGIRGCMGTLYPRQATLSDEIIQQARLAMNRDPRHTPIYSSELAGMRIYVTAVGSPQPVRSMTQISPGRDGAYLRSGSKEAVVLPGEAKTQRYLLAFLKAKAGLKKGEPFQLARFEALSLEFKPPKIAH